MDATTQTAEPLHRVKRAYTRKAVVTKEPNVRLEGADVGVQYDDEVPVPHPVNASRIEKESLEVREARIERIRASVIAAEKQAVIDKSLPVLFATFAGNDKAQVYALRVWHGQSVDLPVAERCARVIAALKGQNLPTDNIALPHEDAARYL